MDMSINWIALIVASFTPLLTGFIWYHPKVFGTVWIKETGISEEQQKKMNPAKTYGIAVVLAFILSIFIWSMVFLGGAPPDDLHGTPEFITFKHGVLHGAILSLLVVLPVFTINALFEVKSFKYILINVGYWLLTIALMGGIINAWV
jgi:hypothetical protein